VGNNIDVKWLETPTDVVPMENQVVPPAVLPVCGSLPVAIARHRDAGCGSRNRFGNERRDRVRAFVFARSFQLIGTFQVASLRIFVEQTATAVGAGSLCGVRRNKG